MTGLGRWIAVGGVMALGTVGACAEETAKRSAARPEKAAVHIAPSGPLAKKAALARISGCSAELTAELHGRMVKAEEAQGRRAVRLRSYAHSMVFAFRQVIQDSQSDAALRHFLTREKGTLRACFAQPDCKAFAACLNDAEFGIGVHRVEGRWTFRPPAPRAPATGGPPRRAVPGPWENAIPGIDVPPPTKASKAAAKKLIETAVRRVGGWRRLASVRSSRWDIDITIKRPGGPKLRGKLRVLTAEPGRLYTRLRKAGPTIEKCIQGAQGVRVADNVVVKMSAEEVERTLHEHSLYRDLLDWRKGGVTIHQIADRPAGKGRKRRLRLAYTRDDRLLYVEELHPKSLRTLSTWRRTQWFTVGLATVEARNEDWRVMSGTRIPRVTRIFVNGEPFLGWVVRRFERNPRIDPKVFTCGGKLPKPTP